MLIKSGTYEKNFRSTRAIDIFEYKGHTIYSYQQDATKELGYTFWYSERDGDYASSIKTLEEAKIMIDKTIVMINCIKPCVEKQYKGKKYMDGSYCGDFIHGDKTLLGEFEEGLYEKPFLFLSYFEYNKLEALEALNINKNYFENFKYNCPFTKREYYGVMPLLIVSDNISKYVQNFHKSKQDMILDMNFQRDYFNITTPLEDLVGSITTSMMGAGYTCCCSPSDGCKDLTLSVIPLDNGDTLVCVNHIWFNN